MEEQGTEQITSVEEVETEEGTPTTFEDLVAGLIELDSVTF